MNPRPSFKSSSFPIKNGLAPLIASGKGPKALPMILDFTINAVQDFDFVQEMEGGVIDFIQGVFIDNSNNPNSLTLLFTGTNQKIVVPATSQGIWPVICPSENLHCTASTLTGNGLLVSLLFLNVPTAYTSWGPITVNASFAIVRGAYASKSGVIAAGGVSQQLAAANANRNRLIIQNPGTAAGQGIGAAESLFVNFTGNAGVNDGTSMEIFPGGYFDTSFGPVSTQAVNINGATINHKFIAWEM